MQHDPELVREILGAFWKIHILHHAAEEPISGHWMLKELREHGYDISPGTLYPLLKRMADRHGWLERDTRGRRGPKDAQLYRATPLGLEILQIVRQQLAELRAEVEDDKNDEPNS